MIVEFIGKFSACCQYVVSLLLSYATPAQRIALYTSYYEDMRYYIDWSVRSPRVDAHSASNKGVLQ